MLLNRRQRLLLAVHTAQAHAEIAEIHQRIVQVQVQVQTREEEKKRKNRRWWVRQWIGRRDEMGYYHQLMRELEAEDPESFINFTRMTPQMFKYLLQRIGPLIQKKDTNWRPALPAGLNLSVALRYYATGCPYKALRFGFRLPHNTISLLLREVSEAIIEVLSSEVVKLPRNPKEWMKIAANFETRWNFPHILGAIDGKHIAIKKPFKSGSLYHNYKGFFP